MSVGLLVSDCPIKNGDPIFTTEQVQRLDMHLLRNLAAQSESEAVSGRSTKLELMSYFGRQRTIIEYNDRHTTR